MKEREFKNQCVRKVSQGWNKGQTLSPLSLFQAAMRKEAKLSGSLLGSSVAGASLTAGPGASSFIIAKSPEFLPGPSGGHIGIHKATGTVLSTRVLSKVCIKWN